MRTRHHFLTAPFLLAMGAAFIQGCTTFSSTKQSQEIQDIGGGTYSLGASKTSSLLDSKSWTEGLNVAVGKAGDFCHAKGLKLADTHAVGNGITFKCASDTKPQ